MHSTSIPPAPITGLPLDALRGGAALVVFAAHAAVFWLDAWQSALPARLLHAADLAVIVFFVVSGLLIVTSLCRRAERDRRGRVDLTAFARDRARRLLPTLAVALLVTTLCDALLLAIGPPGYEAYWSGRLALGVTLFLPGLVPAFPIPLANGPLWSLAHEGWFYVAGAALFVGPRHPAFAIGALLLALGALATFDLLPAGGTGERSAHWLPGFVVWAAGGAIALSMHHGRLPAPGSGTRRMALVGLWVALAICATLDAAGATGARYAFGILLALLIGTGLCVAGPAPRFRPTERWLAPLAAVAPFSYTLYVLHYPLVLLWNVLTDGWQRSLPGLLLTCTVGTIGIIALCRSIGLRIERLGRASTRAYR